MSANSYAETLSLMESLDGFASKKQDITVSLKEASVDAVFNHGGSHIHRLLIKALGDRMVVEVRCKNSGFAGVPGLIRKHLKGVTVIEWEMIK